MSRIVGIVVITFVFVGLWFHDKVVSRSPAQPVSASNVQRSHPAPIGSPSSPLEAHEPARDLWQKYAATRQKVLQDNPALAAEDKALTTEAWAQHQELDAAMAKADPRLAPVLARMDGRPPSAAASSSGIRTPSPATTSAPGK